MAFQIKSFTAITASMLNRLRSATQVVTDFNVGSGIRTALEAVAQEIEQLYIQLVQGITSAIPVSIYQGFNFVALPPIAAGGLAAVVITPQTAAVTIAAGTTFTAPNGNVYTSTSAETIPPGNSTVNVPLVATVAGAAGNLAAGTPLSMSAVPAGFLSASNTASFTNGSDVETDAARQIRFQGYITTLSRGTNAALAYGAKTTTLTNAAGAITEQVLLATVSAPTINVNAPIFVYPVIVYIHNGTGGTSAALVAQCQTIINGYTATDGTLVPGYKAAGTPTTVTAATEQPLAVTATIYAATGYTSSALAPIAQGVIANYLLGLGIGQTAILSEIIALVMDIPGVSDFQVSAPTANTTAAVGVKIMPGVIGIAAG